MSAVGDAITASILQSMNPQAAVERQLIDQWFSQQASAFERHSEKCPVCIGATQSADLCYLGKMLAEQFTRLNSR